LLVSHVDVILADHAQVSDGKLFISGGGINIARFDGRRPAGQPYVVTFAIAGTIDFGGTGAGAHRIRFEVIDADGGPAGVDPAGQRIELSGEAEAHVALAGAPVPGEELTLPFAFQLVGAPFAAPGRYTVNVFVDGEPAEPKTFTIALPPRTVTFGGGLGEFTLPER
jgi:hypothetical protein